MQPMVIAVIHFHWETLVVLYPPVSTVKSQESLIFLKRKLKTGEQWQMYEMVQTFNKKDTHFLFFAQFYVFS